MTLPNLRPVSWGQDMLPDFLWLQAIREATGDLAAAHEPLDILDQFVVEELDQSAPPFMEGDREMHPTSHLDGRVSTFTLIPEKRRTEALAALLSAAPWALPGELMHALALYPECPAAWLASDWLSSHTADPDFGATYLKKLVSPLLDPRGRPSSQVRLLPIARMAKHGKLHLASDMEIIDLLGRYPTGLGEEDQLHVEQWGRATWGAFSMTFDRRVADTWAKYFWRQSWEVSACESSPLIAPPAADEDEDSAAPAEPSEGEAGSAPSIQEVRRAFAAAIDELGIDLRRLQEQAKPDIYEPTADEVKLGLASRAFRLLRHLVSTPELWTNELAPHVFRSLIDLRIISAWLLRQDDPELFRKFKEYGVGKRKLFKLQLEDLMDRDDVAADRDDADLHQRLQAEVNQDVREEFVQIDLGGSFSGKNIRQMAIDAELGDLYSLSYQPLSTEAHGEWGSLIAFDLRPCGNPLHRYHRLGTFTTSQTAFVHLGWVRNALVLGEELIEEIYRSYGLDAGPLFERCLNAMARAQQAGSDRPQADGAVLEEG